MKIGKTQYNVPAFADMSKEDFVKMFGKDRASKSWPLIQKELKKAGLKKKTKKESVKKSAEKSVSSED